MSDLKSKPILWTFHKLQDFCCCTANNLVFFSTQEALDTEYSMSCRNLFWKIKKWPSSSTALKEREHPMELTPVLSHVDFKRTTRNQTLFNLNLKPADLLPSKQRNKHIMTSHPLTQIYVPLAEIPFTPAWPWCLPWCRRQGHARCGVEPWQVGKMGQVGCVSKCLKTFGVKKTCGFLLKTVDVPHILLTPHFLQKNKWFEWINKEINREINKRK